MQAYSTVAWEGLFVAEAGASAALAGLLFVAISMNLERILQGAGLPGRAGEAMVLVAVLVVSTLGLVPGQSPMALGAELLGAGLVAWLILVVIHLQAVRRRVGPSPGVLAGRVVMAQVAVLPLPTAGVLRCFAWVVASTGWFPGSCCASWSRCSMRRVLLIEILR